MQKSNFLKTLGPGVLFASTAIGVSHLVQSTRAGADYGFALIGAIFLANILKYPFFEFASRYANVTGTSIIDGYRRVGKWMLLLYFAITLFSMFFVTAAVGFVTAGFMENLLGLNAIFNYSFATTTILFALCFFILIIGKYSALDGVIKIIGLVLFISTALAFVLTLNHGPIQKIEGFIAPEIFTQTGFVFTIALMGWMPTALDLSAWNSLWTIERIKQTGYKPTLKETIREFNLGYFTSVVLSFCFLTLGAFLMFGSGISLPDSSAAFAAEVVRLYTATIGDWSKIIIGASAFSIMFGTSIAVFDGYARSIERCIYVLKEGNNVENPQRPFYKISLLVLALGSYLIIISLVGKKGFTALIDTATTISFVLSPVIAIINFKLVQDKYIGKDNAPGIWKRRLSYLGIVFLTLFSIIFLLNKFNIINFNA